MANYQRRESWAERTKRIRELEGLTGFTNEQIEFISLIAAQQADREVETLVQKINEKLVIRR